MSCKLIILLLMLLETVSNLWGRTLNPANGLLCAGGSFGGEGAIPACLGSRIRIEMDSGVLVRVPAAFNGPYALKPSSKRVNYLGCQNNSNGVVSIASHLAPWEEGLGI